MKLYSEEYSETFSAIKTKPPRLSSRKSTKYCWDFARGKINGIDTKFFMDYSYGCWVYFEVDGEWRKSRLFGNDIRNPEDVKSLNVLMERYEEIEFEVK